VKPYNLNKYSSVGSYPLFMARGGRAYCIDCANEELPSPHDVIDANWENPEFFCDQCDARIESAYAEHLRGYHGDPPTDG
jgi:hypothetical protein